MASDVSSEVEKIVYVLGSEGSLHTGVSVLLFVLCEYCGHFCTSLLLSVELGGHLCSKLPFLRCLVMHFQRSHRTAAGLPHRFELNPSKGLKISLRSLLTPFDAPQILCALIVLLTALSVVIDTDVPGRCPAAVLR